MPANIALICLGVLLMAIGIIAGVLSHTKSIFARARHRSETGPVTTNKSLFKRTAGNPAFVIILLGLICMLVGNSFTVIPTGYTGVRTTFGLIDEDSCMPGFNAITPFVQKINLVNNKQQDVRVTERIYAETNTETTVYIDNVVVTYAVAPEASAWIYAHVENWVEDLIDKDIIGNACRSAARQCSNDTVTERSTIEPLAKEYLQAVADEKYGAGRIEIKTVLIVNMDFDESYNAAIAKRSSALQEQQEQEIRNQIDIDKAEAAAEQERRIAQGEADAELIRAEGKAEANKIISSSITDATQRQDMIDKWDGSLPKATGDNVGVTILDIMDTGSDTKANNTPTTVTPGP